MSLFVDDNSLFSRDSAESDRNAPEDPEVVDVDDAGSRVSNMIVEEYAERVLGQEHQEQLQEGSVVGDQAPWQHISIRERNEVEREVDLMVMMLGWNSNFARLSICNWRLETVLPFGRTACICGQHRWFFAHNYEVPELVARQITENAVAVFLCCNKVLWPMILDQNLATGLAVFVWRAQRPLTGELPTLLPETGKFLTDRFNRLYHQFLHRDGSNFHGVSRANMWLGWGNRCGEIITIDDSVSVNSDGDSEYCGSEMSG